MDFDDSPPHRPTEPFVPMINVVFLLLIFFLMAAQIAPPEPFELSPPETAAGGDPVGETSLSLSAEGVFAYQDLRGDEAAAEAIAAATASGGPLRLRVDADMMAVILAARMSALAAAEAGDIEVLTTPR